MSSKHGSGENSNNISNNMSNNESNLSITTISRSEGPMEVLKRTRSKFKAKTSSDKKEQAEMKEESSFKEAHEYGLDSLEPVASGLGDGLVSSMEREFSHIMNHRDSRTMDDTDIIERIQLTPENVPNYPGPGSYIISPSPSVSSDDEASFVEKRPRSRDAGLPYGLPGREEPKQFSVWPRLPHNAPPVPEVPPQFLPPASSSGQEHSSSGLPRSSSGLPRSSSGLPRSSSGLLHGITSPLSADSYYSEYTSDIDPRRKVRRKLSKEKWMNKTKFSSDIV
jgi:hypothetical protein